MSTNPKKVYTRKYTDPGIPYLVRFQPLSTGVFSWFLTDFRSFMTIFPSFLQPTPLRKIIKSDRKLGGNWRKLVFNLRFTSSKFGEPNPSLPWGAPGSNLAATAPKNGLGRAFILCQVNVDSWSNSALVDPPFASDSKFSTPPATTINSPWLTTAHAWECRPLYKGDSDVHFLWDQSYCQT